MRIEEKIHSFIVEELQWQGAELTDETELLEGSVLDSMGVFQLVAFLEGEFGIQVKDEDLVPDRFGTITAIAHLVEQRQAA